MRKIKNVTCKAKKISKKKYKKITLNKKTPNKIVKKKSVRKRKKKIEIKSLPILPPTPPKVEIIEPQPKKPRKRRTKNVSKMYFTQDTEDAIIAYNKEENLEIRETIFREKIFQPFQKLVENVFNTFKFSYFKTSPQDVQKECLTHLVANMHKFNPDRRSKTDPDKKAKAYSYFSIIAKHYLILLNNNNYKEFNQNIEISEDRNENTVQLQQDDKYYAQQELSDFIELIIEFWEKNVDKIFTKQRDLNIANAVVELFRNSKNIAMFNKKALYLYIREMAACKTQQITKVINKMKQYQDNLQRSYTDYGIVNMDRHTV